MREPSPLGELLRSLIRGLGGAEPETWQRMRDEWKEIAGSPWAERSTPVSLVARTLTVRVESPAALSVLKYGRNSLLENLQRAFGEGAVKDIRVVSPGRGAPTN